jgi:hypothetical protein
MRKENVASAFRAYDWLGIDLVEIATIENRFPSVVACEY